MDSLLATARLELLRKMLRVNTRALQLGLMKNDAEVIGASRRNLEVAIAVGIELGEAGEFATPKDFVKFIQEQVDLAMVPSYTNAMVIEDQNWTCDNLKPIMGEDWTVRHDIMEK